MNVSPTRKQLTVAMIMLLTLLSTSALAIGHRSSSKMVLAQDTSQLVGNWTGESICQVKNSPCQNEQVVYHISKSKEPGQVTVSADKIVDGKAINMGTGDYTYDGKNGTLLNETAGRVWRFTVQGKKMEGTLTLPDKTVYRRVTLKKEE